MDGLQKIQDRILEQAQIKAAEVAERAERQCQEILAQAKTEEERILSEAREKTRAQVEARLNRARSLAAMEKRKNNLLKRQQLIDQVIEEALDRVCNLPDQEKLDLYVKMILQTGARGGEITLAAKDQALGTKLVERLGNGFELAKLEGAFAGGLLLRKGKIEDNLTFDLIVRNERPNLSAVALAALPSVFAADLKE